MNNLLKKISAIAIVLADFEFSQEQIQNKWIGTKPTPDTEIKKAEKRLGIEFPTDFKQFLSITNGFSAPNDTEPTFGPVDQIDFLKNIDNDIIEAYSIDEEYSLEEQLKSSLVVGGINEEQYFLLIPPNSTNDEWKYWKFANWIPGAEEYENLESYFIEVLDFMNEEMELE